MVDRFQVVKVDLRQVLLGGKDNVHKWKKETGTSVSQIGSIPRDIPLTLGRGERNT